MKGASRHLQAAIQWSLATALALCGCVREDTLRDFQLRSALAPTSSCTYTTTNDPISEGYYDPSVADTDGYTLALLVQNNLETSSGDSVGWSNVTSITGTQHAIALQSVEGCWYLASEEPSSGVVDCDKLASIGQGQKFPVSVIVDEGGSQQVATLRILTLAHMRSLFGATFSPNDIPILGAYHDPTIYDTAAVAAGGNIMGGLTAFRDFPEEPPTLASGLRAAAWGEKYPDTHQAQVVYRLRVVGQKASGSKIYSNWLRFPVTVCPKCLRDQCGPLVQKWCARGPCSDGTPCLQGGVCANSSAFCTPAVLMSGQVPNFATSGLCLPAQGFAESTPVTCVDVGCDATN